MADIWSDQKLRRMARALSYDGRIIDDLVSVGMEASWRGQSVRWRMIDELRHQTPHYDHVTHSFRRYGPVSLEHVLNPYIDDEYVYRPLTFAGTFATKDQTGEVELRVMVSRLPKRLRLVLVLRYWCDLDQIEIATFLGVTGSRVCQMEKDARARLKRMVA